jgi:hypothetical protein
MTCFERMKRDRTDSFKTERPVYIYTWKNKTRQADRNPLIKEGSMINLIPNAKTWRNVVLWKLAYSNILQLFSTGLQKWETLQERVWHFHEIYRT